MTATPAAPAPKRNRSRIILISVIAGIVVLALFAAGGVLIAHVIRGNAGSEVASGITFTAPAGDYEVNFPAEPETNTIPQTAGEYELELNIATWESDDEYYAVNSTAYPPEVMEQDLDEMLINSVTGMVTSTPNGTLIESEFGELDGARAMTGSIDVGEAGTMYFTLSVSSNTQYTLLSLGHDRSAHDAFADSFSFTP